MKSIVMLNYRRCTAADIPFLFQCYAEKDVAERASLMFEDDFKEFRDSYLSILKNQLFHLFILELSKSPLGFIQIRETDSKIREAKGGVWLGHRRNVGYGLSAFCLMFHLSFEILKYKKIWGWVRGNNTVMHKICRRFELRVTDICERPAFKIGCPNYLEKIFYYEITLQEYIYRRDLFLKFGRFSM